jgi:hypothetical protein
MMASNRLPFGGSMTLMKRDSKDRAILSVVEASTAVLVRGWIRVE